MKSTGWIRGMTAVRISIFSAEPNERPSALLQQYLARIDDDRLKRTFAAAIDAGQPAVTPISRPARPRSNLWKGFSSRSNH